MPGLGTDRGLHTIFIKVNIAQVSRVGKKKRSFSVVPITAPRSLFWTAVGFGEIMTYMKTLNIDEATFQQWEDMARARGLTVAAWLKWAVDQAAQSPPPANGVDQLQKLEELERSLEGRGDQPTFEREELYD